MRLLSLHVENYGIFADRGFDFGSGRLQLICGPNEAGKSTLRQLVREMLFGFPHQNPLKLTEGVDMAATAKVVLADGRELRFRRRKGRKDAVVGQLDDGQQIGEPELAQLLGGAGLPLFQSVFAFSLEELSAGQQSLQQAELTEALFGGAIGGLGRFKSLRERIEREASGLFTPRATKRPINTLLSQARELAERLQETAAQPAEYQQLVRDHQQLQEAIVKLTRNRDQLQDARQEASRMVDAWAPFLKLRQLKQQQVGDSLQLSAEQWEQAARLRGEIRQLEDRLQQQQEVIRRRQAGRQPAVAEADSKILAQQDQVQSLVQDMGRIQGFDERRPKLRRELEHWTERLRGRLRDLELHWDLKKLDQIPDDGQMQQRLLRTANELVDARRQLDEARQQEMRHRRELAEVDAELSGGSADDAAPAPNLDDGWDDWGDDWESDDTVESPGKSEQDEGGVGDADADADAEAGGHSTWESLTDLGLGAAAAADGDAKAPSDAQSERQRTRLERLLDAEPDDVAARRQLAALAKQLQDHRREADELEGKMRRLGPDWDWQQAPADESQLAELAERWQMEQPELRSAERSRQELAQAAATARREVETLRQDAPPDSQQLRELRQRRDEAWALVRKHYVEGAAQDEAAEGRFQCDVRQLVERFAALTGDADRAADVRQEKADLVAQLAAKREEAERAEKRVEAAEQRLRQVRQTLTAMETKWRQVWPGGPPPGARAATAWFDLRKERDLRRREAQQLETQAAPLRQAADSYLAELRQAVAAAAADNDVDPNDLDALRVELRERLRRHQQWEARREQLRLQRPKLVSLADAAQRDQQRNAERLRQLELAWNDLRERMGLPAAWAPEEFAAKWTEITAAENDRRKQLELDEQVRQTTAEIDAFRQRVQRVAGESEQDRSAIETLHALTRRLDAARESQQLRTAGEEEDKRLADELQRLQQQLAAERTNWDALREASGAASDESFAAAVDGASVHQQLAAAERELQAALRCDDPARRRTLLDELQRSDEAELRRRLAEADRRLAEAERERSQRLKDEGAAADRLRRLDNSDRAAAVDMQRQSCLAELSETVDRWAPLMLAGEMMDRALARFEREHQPALLADVGGLLKRMTGEAYVEVVRQLDKRATLQVIDAAGAAKSPQQLSTGTREQLYLAIRLAYVRHYCRRNEPLPLVMDDVLVNFDEPRARRTIEVLDEMADDVQVLLLTCHRGTSRLVHQVCTGMQPILLSRDGTETLDSWITTPRTRTRRPGASPGQGVLFPKG